MDIHFHDGGEDDPRAVDARRRALSLLSASATGDHDLSLQVFGDVLREVAGDVDLLGDVMWVLSQLAGGFVVGEDEGLTPRETLRFMQERWGA